MNFRNPFVSVREMGENVSNAQYIAQTAKRGDRDYVMTRSSLMEFAHCPHKWIQSPEPESTKALDWGSLVDCLLLSPNMFEFQFAVRPETYVNDDGDEKPWATQSNTCKKWLREHSRFTVITSAELRDAKRAVEVLKADKHVKSILECSRRQVMFQAVYRDNDTKLSIPCKILIDLLPESRSRWRNCIVDLKTAADATTQKWGRKVNDFDYDAQGAFYRDIFNQASGESRDSFLHIVQESEPPYEIGRRLLSIEFLELGQSKYFSALRLYAQCLKNGEWPGYDDSCTEYLDGFALTEPEPWMLKQVPIFPVLRPIETALARLEPQGDPLSAA